jgi:aminopeptidase-like protein
MDMATPILFARLRSCVGLFQRSQFATFPQYHTSDDDLDFIKPEHLAASYRTICAAIGIVEHDCRLQTLNRCARCEPHLGRRGLYTGVGGKRTGQ